MDESSACRVRDFLAKFCQQSKGQFSGQPLNLIPWQWDFVREFYGTKRDDGLRKYTRAGIWIPKKNGKSTLMSGLALYHLMADFEQGAEVYLVANSIQQASIVFNEAANMVERSPALASRLWVRKNIKTIEFKKNQSVLRVMSSEAKAKHGFNSSAIIFDELAEQVDRTLWDVLRYSTASRQQPVTISISTAGFLRESLGFEQWKYAVDVKNSKVIDPSFLPVIYAADPLDDWTHPDTWKKCNPSIGVTVPLRDFEEAVNEARAEPRKEASFKTLRCNIWCGHSDQWLPSLTWAACVDDFDESTLAGRECFVGVDLARKHDLASYVLVFPIEDKFYFLPRFFSPRESAEKKEKSDHIPLMQWERDNHITLTDGDVIDFQAIRKSINEDAKKFDIQEIGFDPWNAEMLCQLLRDEDGFQIVEVRQTMAMMGPATNHFERLIYEKKLKHNNHPILNWNSQNCTTRSDSNGNIMVDKLRSTNRIDGISASITGLSRAMVYSGSGFGICAL